MKQKTTKQKTTKQLMKKLDTLFSEYIRRRHADENGYTKCVSCGKVDHWKNLQNGHYWNRNYKGTYFDEVNCNVQCLRCNHKDYLRGNYPSYTVYMIEHYGIEEFKALEVRAKKLTKMPSFWLEMKIEEYEKKLKELNDV